MESYEEYEKPHFTLIWTLENITKRVLLKLTSPSFVADTIDKKEWCLVVWERKGKLFCRPCKNHESGNVEIEYETAIITANGTVLNEKRQKKNIDSKCEHLVRISSGAGENVLLKAKDMSDIKGTLTIRCKMWKPGYKCVRSSFCFAHTRLKQERRYFTWTIPEFSSLIIGQRHSFHLQVTPRGNLLRVLDLFLQSDDNEDKICIETSKEFPYEVSSKVSVMDAVGNIICSKSISGNAALIKVWKLMTNKNLYLPNDTLHLRCECEIDFGVVSHRIENYQQFPTSADKQDIGTSAMNDDRTEQIFCCPKCCPLKKTVKKYYEDKELSDIILRVGNESFPAHKIVLSAKSKVFEEMFTKDKSRKGKRVLELTDLDSDILRCLLVYMYSEEVKDLTSESAMKLYKAAIKYELHDLREACSIFLESNLNRDNIFSVLNFAEKQRNGNLKSATRSYIFEHANEIFKSTDWKNFKKKNPMLAMDVIQCVDSLTQNFSSVLHKFNEVLNYKDDE